MNDREDKKRILIVDDDSDVQMMIKFGLQRAGFLVEAVGDGQQATEIVPQLKPHLIVLDIMMPVMDGLRFLNWLRADETYNNIKVLIHTAVASHDVKEEAEAAGALLLIEKPKQLPHLVAEVQKLIDN